MKKLFLFAALLVSQAAFAQQPIVPLELACPAGSAVLVGHQTLDASTGMFRQNVCVDNNGVVSSPVFAGLPLTNDGLQFVSVNGSDTNNGFSWDKAKRTLEAAYAALPASGTSGVVVVATNFSETLGGSLTLNKTNTGFVFEGRANIEMNGNQVIVSPGTFGVFLSGPIHDGGGDVAQGVRFFYRIATGNAFQIGASTADTRMFSMRNVTVDLTDAAGSSSLTGIALTRVIYFDLDGAGVVGSVGATSIGVSCDGTGNFCGTGSIRNPYIVENSTGILGTGSGAAGMNAVTISGGTIASSTVGAIGLDLEAGSNNWIYSDFESNSVAIKLGASAIGNYGVIRNEANTTDIQALAGSKFNTIKTLGNGGATSTIVATDSGTDNHFSREIDGNFNTASSGGFIFTGKCASATSPAACGSSSAGAFTIAAAATTATVNTSAVSATSVILVNENQSLGATLGVTCNVGTIGKPIISAVSAGVSFTITIPASLATNPVCMQYTIQ